MSTDANANKETTLLTTPVSHTAVRSKLHMCIKNDIDFGLKIFTYYML